MVRRRDSGNSQLETSNYVSLELTLQDHNVTSVSEMSTGPLLPKDSSLLNKINEYEISLSDCTFNTTGSATLSSSQYPPDTTILPLLAQTNLKMSFPRRLKKNARASLFDRDIQDSENETPEFKRPRPLQRKVKRKRTINENAFEHILNSSNESMTQPSLASNFITRLTRRRQMNVKNTHALFDSDLISSESDSSFTTHKTLFKGKRSTKINHAAFDSILNETEKGSEIDHSLDKQMPFKYVFEGKHRHNDAKNLFYSDINDTNLEETSIHSNYDDKAGNSGGICSQSFKSNFTDDLTITNDTPVSVNTNVPFKKVLNNQRHVNSSLFDNDLDSFNSIQGSLLNVTNSDEQQDSGHRKQDLCSAQGRKGSWHYQSKSSDFKQLTPEVSDVDNLRKEIRLEDNSTPDSFVIDKIASILNAKVDKHSSANLMNETVTRPAVKFQEKREYNSDEVNVSEQEVSNNSLDKCVNEKCSKKIEEMSSDNTIGEMLQDKSKLEEETQEEHENLSDKGSASTIKQHESNLTLEETSYVSDENKSDEEDENLSDGCSASMKKLHDSNLTLKYKINSSQQNIHQVHNTSSGCCRRKGTCGRFPRGSPLFNLQNDIPSSPLNETNCYKQQDCNQRIWGLSSAQHNLSEKEDKSQFLVSKQNLMPFKSLKDRQQIGNSGLFDSDLQSSFSLQVSTFTCEENTNVSTNCDTQQDCDQNKQDPGFGHNSFSGEEDQLQCLVLKQNLMPFKSLKDRQQICNSGLFNSDLQSSFSLQVSTSTCEENTNESTNEVLVDRDSSLSRGKNNNLSNESIKNITSSSTLSMTTITEGTNQNQSSEFISNPSQSKQFKGEIVGKQSSSTRKSDIAYHTHTDIKRSSNSNIERGLNSSANLSLYVGQSSNTVNLDSVCIDMNPSQHISGTSSWNCQSELGQLSSELSNVDHLRQEMLYEDNSRAKSFDVDNIASIINVKVNKRSIPYLVPETVTRPEDNFQEEEHEYKSDKVNVLDQEVSDNSLNKDVNEEYSKQIEAYSTIGGMPQDESNVEKETQEYENLSDGGSVSTRKHDENKLIEEDENMSDECSASIKQLDNDNLTLKDRINCSDQTIHRRSTCGRLKGVTPLFKLPKIYKKRTLQTIPLNESKVEKILNDLGFAKLKPKKKRSHIPDKSNPIIFQQPEENKKIKKPDLVPNKLKRPQKWVTPKFYEFIIHKLEPQYGIRSRIKAECVAFSLVETIKHIMSEGKDYYRIVEEMKIHLAELGIVQNHFDFRNFIRKYFEASFFRKIYPLQCYGNIICNPYEPDDPFENIL